MSKTEIVNIRLPEEAKAQLKAVASKHEMTVSALLRTLIDGVVEDASVSKTVTNEKFPSKAKRDGKITLSLTSSVREELEVEAKREGLAPSTWGAVLIKRRYLNAPQPTDRQRKFIRAAFLQLRGMANNLNQIAKVMNRGVFTGSNYAPTKSELKVISEDVHQARKDLAKFAAGQYQFQSIDREGE